MLIFGGGGYCIHWVFLIFCNTITRLSISHGAYYTCCADMYMVASGVRANNYCPYDSIQFHIHFKPAFIIQRKHAIGDRVAPLCASA